MEAATVITTLRDLPFPHTALTEIQHDEMTVLLVPDKLSFKQILRKKNPQMNLPLLSQLLVKTSLFDSSALRASLTACEQGPGEYNGEWEHHKENNHECLQLIPMLHSLGTKHLQPRKTPRFTVRQQEHDHPEIGGLQAVVFGVTKPTFAYNKATLVSWNSVGDFLHAPRRSNTPVPTATTSSSGNSQASKAISFLRRQNMCITVFMLAPMHIKNKIK